ncbi:MAG: transposase, partial [Rhodothermales bacterium]|nr:transposase [Rhodothermales bacterium]
SPHRGGSTSGDPAPSAFRSPSGTVGAIVRGYKSAVTVRINRVRGTPGVPVWQRNYWERIVRTPRELDHIRRYIDQNPARWAAGR